MMARKVFFSFHYDRDSWRVSIVRNCQVIGSLDKTPFLDRAAWEKIKRQGDRAVQNWIESQLTGTSVTVVLIGAETGRRRWVKYEIARSVGLQKGLIGVDISKIRDQNGHTDERGPNPLPAGYPLYLWNNDNGRANLGKWIEAAAIKVGR
jgi:Thoeris protein ThsB, TIR-like domain